MIELTQVAQLVHNDIVLKHRGKKQNFVIEIKISPLATGTPTGTVLFDENLPQWMCIVLVKVRESRVHERSGCFFMTQVVGTPPM